MGAAGPYIPTAMSLKHPMIHAFWLRGLPPKSFFRSHAVRTVFPALPWEYACFHISQKGLRIRSEVHLRIAKFPV